MFKQFHRLLSLSLLGWMLVSCSQEDFTPKSSEQDLGRIDSIANATATKDDNRAMGNPSGANTSYSNYLIDKPQYSMSYNSYRGTPNWVSWHLSSAWLGSTPRQDDFRADNSLPSAFYKVQTTDYTGSGFDRGHNAPSADRTLTVTDNSATFLMSNMIPQAPTNNQQTWANLENYCRTLVSQGNELYIIMGQYGKGGTGSNGYKETLASGKITVPNRIWKVIVVLPVGTSDVSRVTTSTRVIAIDTPNSTSISTSWGTYRTTVDAIEAKTGYNILSNVPASIQDVIEARIDNGPTS
ncbi:DNA/RNA non-specific endonuclease [Pontibacter sp. JH31]|uniref:DNA/RNA non-specific endonuclease n=1 Tax=Pontibacter aquaedesilientis TaxID=2766980 RepID=A0ABR7XD31_9BACT|nr:DNA/RNA non-specific endonuclease [Pontibacter aquaedesilientis]MBD1396204.1 DNA/RNA non-specific endonuclease [Pontibacter aquaedesilientis]